MISTISPRPPINHPTPIPFFHILERLKTTKREGWKRFGIQNGESISDHMYRMSIITMLAPPALSSRLNIAHCTKMALVHDMAELLVGDITPVDGVLEEEKHRREAATMDYLMTKLLGTSSATSDQAQGIRDVFHEYEDNQTLEAKFVHDVDKIELMLQMVEYERSQGDGSLDLGEFGGVAGRIQLDEVKAWANEILKEREAFWKEKGTSS